MLIGDGKGKNGYAAVNKNQQLDTFSITEPEDRFLNKQGKTWSVKSETTPVGAGDYIFYLKNTGTETYAITDVRAECGAESRLTIHKVDGTPTFAAGADLTPVARNIGSSEPVTATIKEDTNTTGLTDQGEIFFVKCKTAGELYHLRTTSNIIIPPGTAIAAQSSAATSNRVTWSLTVIDPEL